MALQAELNDIDKGQHGAEWICGSYQCRNFEGWFQQREMGEGNWQFVIIGFGINDCSVYRVNQSGRFTNRSCRLTSRTASPSGGANMAATTGITDRRTKPDTSRQQWKRMFGRQRRKWRAELRDRGAVSLEPIYVRAGQRRRGIVAVSDGDRLELQLLHMADGGSRCRTVAALNAAAKLRQMRAPVSAIREALSSVRAMRCNMDLPILSRRDAEAFFRKIHAAGLMFHLEDDPATILGRGESPLFSPSEIVMLRARIAELHALDWGDHGCPIGYMLQLQREGLLTEDHHETR